MSTIFFIHFMYVFLFCLGAIVGSFLLVVILRSEQEEEIVKTPSHCPYCGKKLVWYELVPILSFIVLKGKCKNCQHKIPFMYPAIEIVTGLLFMLVFWKFNTSPLFHIALTYIPSFDAMLAWLTLFLWLFYVSILLLISIYDFRNFVVLDKFLYIALLVGFVGELSLFLIGKYSALYTKSIVPFGLSFRQFLGGYELLINPWFTGIWDNLLGMIIAWGVIQLIVTLSKGRAMGNGDPIIAAFIGLILGMASSIVFLLLSFIIGGIYSVILLLLKKKTIKQHIAFGPILAVSAMLIFLFGHQIVASYINLLIR